MGSEQEGGGVKWEARQSGRFLSLQCLTAVRVVTTSASAAAAVAGPVVLCLTEAAASLQKLAWLQQCMNAVYLSEFVVTLCEPSVQASVQPRS